ncbi:MAG: TonB-dependent receptor, partial [Robiginitalea sp.]|nr:TonB-dependent receptor [Robiginitalea sp.]
PVQFRISSVPVASTFTPAKGRAAAVQRSETEKIFNTYASLGLGNYNNARADFYTSLDFDRGKQLLDIGLNHFSSRGDIEGTPLDTDFYNTTLDLKYSRKDRDWDWNLGAGIEHRRYNWYGLPESITDVGIVSGIDSDQDYFKAELKGGVSLSDSYFSEAAVTARHFRDGSESSENRLILQTGFELPVTEETLNLGVLLDYVGGEFTNAPLTSTTFQPGTSYGYFQAGLEPSLLLTRDDLKLELGAKLVYGLDSEQSESNFYIYPAVRASYRLLEETVVAYGGIEGGLRQNSYYDFSRENPFLSPTLMIMPTDRQYDAYVGIRGQLLPELSYNLRGSYRAENFLPLFLLNPLNEFRSEEGYAFGNSFRLFYDDVRTLGIFAELQLAVNRNFSLGVNATINEYDTETDNPAWNLPNLEGTLFLDYQIGPRWSLGASLFYVGEREDLSTIAAENVDPEDFPASIVSLDGFFDANIRLGYHLNDQLSIFARASNLANNQYQRWANFRVQGFQVLGGVSYKFDL